MTILNRSVLKFIMVMLLFTAAPAFAQRNKKNKQPFQLPMEARLREAESSFIEGQKFFLLEDFAKALYYFDRVAELNPDNPTVHYKIAELLAKSQKETDLLKAATSIENALRLEKNNKYFYILASNIYTALNNFAKAQKAVEAMLQNVKGQEDYLYELAALYLYDNKLDEAIKIYNKAESILGISEISSQQKQKIYLEQKKIDEALAEGEKLMKYFPDEEQYLMAYAEMLARHNHQEKAITLLENYLKENGEAINPKLLLAGLYRESGQENKARDYVLTLIDDPFIPTENKVLMVGTYITALGQLKANNTTDTFLENFSSLLFQKLKSKDPLNPNVCIVGGDLYLVLKQNEEAKNEYLKAVQYGSTNYEAWQNLLYLESQLNLIDSLIFHSEQGLEIFPNQAMVYYFNGYGNLLKKNFRQAAYPLEQAKKLTSNNPGLVAEINSLLGDTYQGSKDFEKPGLIQKGDFFFFPSWFFYRVAIAVPVIHYEQYYFCIQ